MFWHCHHGLVEAPGWALQVRGGPGGSRKGQVGERMSLCLPSLSETFLNALQGRSVFLLWTRSLDI